MNSKLTELVTIEYRNNNRVQIVHLNSMTRQAVDEYVEVIRAEVVERKTALIRSVQNFTSPISIISPYFLGRLKEFSGQTRTDSHGRVAVVTPVDLFRFMLNPLVKLFSQGSDKLTIQFFKSLDEAVNWVSEYEE
jgi:hypothetical protein